MKRVRIYLMGGTIAATVDEAGNSVITDLKEYVRQFKELDGQIQIEVSSFSRYGGYETKIEDVLRLAGELKRAACEECLDGIVVVMGTNLMEEIAFAIHLLVPVEIPVVITGAMRIATARGADGPANLLSAIYAAADPVCRGLGTLVVFNDEIHAAAFVRKTHTSSPAAFRSDFLLGYITEGKASLRTKPLQRPLPWIDVKTDPKDVLLYESYFSDSGRILDALEGIPYDGLVVEGTGCGSIPGWVLDRVEKIHTQIPVVIASRTGRGDVLTATYGAGYGEPEYYVRNGYHMAGILDGRKARVLLTLLLMSECSNEQIAESFNRYSKYYKGE